MIYANNLFLREDHVTSTSRGVCILGLLFSPGFREKYSSAKEVVFIYKAETCPANSPSK